MSGSAAQAYYETADALRLTPRPLVSVVMATYNQEQYLAAAIDGVLSQHVEFAVELLIGDDCSKDGTLALALQMQGEHPCAIRVLSGTSNVGLLANYARLIRACRGEFIASCDGDDVWTDPGKLQRQVKVLREIKNVGAIHTEFDHILWRNGRWHELREFHRHWYGDRAVPQGRVFNELLKRNFIQISTACFRGDLLRMSVDEGALNTAYSINDWPLCLHVAARSDIAYLPESTTRYRKVAGSMTNSGYAARVRFFEGQVAMIENVCRRFDVAAADQIDALTRLYRPMLSAAFFAGATETFARTLAWLRENDSAYARSWRGRLLPLLAKSRLAHGILRVIQDARVRWREVVAYR